MADRNTTSRKELDVDELPLQAARLLAENRSYRTVSRWMFALFIAFILAAFLPWQQNVQGTGVVSALNPADRPQTLPSRIDGRIERWFVAEGQRVAKGAPIVQISEIKDESLDPEVVTRTQEQLDATIAANRDKRRKADALAAQIDALEDGLVAKLDQTRNKLEKARADSVQAAIADSVATDQFRRRETLFRSELGIVSLNDLQSYRVKAQEAQAKRVSAEQEVRNVTLDLATIEAEAREKIEKARSDRAATLAEVSEGDAKIAQYRNKIANLEARRSFYRIDAPQDVYVVKAFKQGVGEQVKAGDPIVTLQPADPKQAVELFVRPMGVPLLRPGPQVRLQFDGWPALQFSGWPAVSVGTFGGVVTVIDQVASTNGRFRVLVTPDPDDEPWPPQLRLGSGVYGWAMLDNVRVWFEIWRQLNGFPPSIAAPDAATDGDKGAGGAKDGGGKK